MARRTRRPAECGACHADARRTSDSERGCAKCTRRITLHPISPDRGTHTARRQGVLGAPMRNVSESILASRFSRAAMVSDWASVSSHVLASVSGV